jgi:hypothetical protein
MLVSLYMLILIEIEILMLMMDLLNLLFTSFHILAHCYLLVISLWSPVRNNDEYNYLNI